MAAPAFAFTISRAAEILGDDEQLLWDLADEMDPEDSCLWIPWHRGSADDCLHARRNGISERAARGAQTQSVLSAALNGWLRIIHRIIQGFHKRRNNVRISAKVYTENLQN